MKYLKSAEGWTSEEDLAYLFELAKSGTGKGIITEIGSWKRRSTVAIALGTKIAKREKVFAIDPHKGEHTLGSNKVKIKETFKEFSNNLKKAGVEDFVVPILKTSSEASKIIKYILFQRLIYKLL